MAMATGRALHAIACLLACNCSVVVLAALSPCGCLPPPQEAKPGPEAARTNGLSSGRPAAAQLVLWLPLVSWNRTSPHREERARPLRAASPACLPGAASTTPARSPERRLAGLRAASPASPNSGLRAASPASPTPVCAPPPQLRLARRLPNSGLRAASPACTASTTPACAPPPPGHDASTPGLAAPPGRPGHVTAKPRLDRGTPPGRSRSTRRQDAPHPPGHAASTSRLAAPLGRPASTRRLNAPPGAATANLPNTVVLMKRTRLLFNFFA
nr:uncharacterized protein LOC127339342 [Lolium perenne]